MVDRTIKQNKTPRRKQDPAATRAKILKAAMSKFAESGFAGTSISDVAKSAGVQKSLVQYHFGSKESLWAECLEEHLQLARDGVIALVEGKTRLADFVRMRYDLMKRRPELVRIMAWSSLEPHPTIRAIETMQERVAEKAPSLPTEAVLAFVMTVSAMDGYFMLQRLAFQGPIKWIGGPDFEMKYVKALLSVVELLTPNYEEDDRER